MDRRSAVEKRDRRCVHPSGCIYTSRSRTRHGLLPLLAPVGRTDVMACVFHRASRCPSASLWSPLIPSLRLFSILLPPHRDSNFTTQFRIPTHSPQRSHAPILLQSPISGTFPTAPLVRLASRSDPPSSRTTQSNRSFLPLPCPPPAADHRSHLQPPTRAIQTQLSVLVFPPARVHAARRADVRRPFRLSPSVRRICVMTHTLPLARARPLLAPPPHALHTSASVYPAGPNHAPAAPGSVSSCSHYSF